jgi:para-nitrobenzyl esterase
MPARRRARQQAGRGQRVWLYRFGYVPQALRKVLPGVGHADEIQFVFGVPSPAARAGWSNADRAMAKTVGDYWVAFARTGDPNHPGAPRWPMFTGKGQKGIQFGADGIATLDTTLGNRLDALEGECCSTP